MIHMKRKGYLHGSPPDYSVHSENRQRWAFEVRYRDGQTIARCDTSEKATRVAKALNIALAASLAAAREV